jgi:threonine dehydrogenase-like Zn-dependent dehydrogenase
VVAGHEAVATVHALGAGVTADSLGRPLREGDRVVYTYFRPCRQCWACLTGKSTCPNRNQDWLNHGADEPPHFRGAFGDFLCLNPGHAVFRVPDDLPDRWVSPVNCAFAQVLYALDRGPVSTGDTVVIQGAGGLGLYATVLAREGGAARVVVVDRRPERLALAQRFGADLTLNAAETMPDDRIDAVLQATGGIGADLVLEVTGSPAVIQEGVRMLRPGGNYLWVGNVGVGVSAEIVPTEVIRQHKTITGVVAYAPYAIPRALAFMQRARERYPFGAIVSHHFPFEQVNDALAIAERGECIRASVVMDRVGC